MRFAIYFTPAEDHPLTAAAAAWLGRDAYAGRDLAHGPSVPEMAASLLRYHLAAPRRYGFHGTIVAPFEPAPGAGERQISTMLEEFCAGEAPFEIEKLVLGRLGSFLALVPHAPCAALQQMASRAVEFFSPVRAPLGERDIARRKPERLSPRQTEYLFRWGYPYVMEEFRFHMTLSGQLDAEILPLIEVAAGDWFADHVGVPLAVDGLALFAEPQQGAPLTVLRRFPFERN